MYGYAPLLTVQPNAGKALLVKGSKVAGVYALVLGFLVFFQQAVGFDVFSDVAELMDVKVETSNITFAIVGLAVVFFVVQLALTYAKYGRQHYDVSSDRILGEGKDVPFVNVTRIMMEQKGAEKLLGAATIIVELSGLPWQELRIEYVDNAAQTIAAIQQYVNAARQPQQGYRAFGEQRAV